MEGTPLQAEIGTRIPPHGGGGSTIKLTRNCCLLKRAEIPFFSFKTCWAPFSLWTSASLFAYAEEWWKNTACYRHGLCASLDRRLIRLYLTAGLKRAMTSISYRKRWRLVFHARSFLVHVVLVFQYALICCEMRYTLRRKHYPSTLVS